MIQRKEYLKKLIAFRDKQLIKVVTGVRRCGKSTLLKMYQEWLREQGVEASRIISINFEDIDYEELTDYRKLYDYLKEHLNSERMTYIFLDEIQNVADFPKVVDSLYIKNNVDIYMTGSNAYMLSSEIATLISGRYVQIEMLPFSFKEYMSAMQPGTSLETAYRRYVEKGAFPYLLQIADDSEMVREYLTGLYNTIVLKDVVARKRMTDVMMLESIVRFLADNIGNLSVIKRVSDTLVSLGRKTSAHTVENYISALADSYIFYPVYRYDTKGKQLLKTGQKYYLVDIGLRNIINGTKGGDLGHILENLIFLELARRGGEIYVGKADNAEIDFVVIHGERREYYQVALSVRDEATMQRELAPLLALPDSYPKYLLTLDNDPVVYHEGIKQVYALEWMIDK